MFSLYSLLKTYIQISISWFIFMLSIITQRFFNGEDVHDVFGISLVDTTLYIFTIISIIFVSLFLFNNKIYFNNDKFICVS